MLYLPYRTEVVTLKRNPSNLNLLTRKSGTKIDFFIVGLHSNPHTCMVVFRIITEFRILESQPEIRWIKTVSLFCFLFI